MHNFTSPDSGRRQPHPGRLLPEPRRGKDLGGMRSQVHLFGQHLAHQPRQAGTPVTPGHPKKSHVKKPLIQ